MLHQSTLMNEQALIQDILSGKTRSFAQLVNDYAQKLALFVSRMVPQQLDAEEITEDVLVKAYQHLAEYDEKKATFWTWLCRIAYNESLNHLRIQRPTIISIDNDGPPDTDEDWMTAAQGDNENLDSRIDLLNQAIDRLPPDDRMLIELFYYDDQPVKDIAIITGQSKTNILTRLSRIRKRLHKEITKHL